MKKRFHLLLRIVVSIGAMYVVYRKTDTMRLATILPSISAAWLIPAFLFYNASQVLSTWRSTQFLRCIRKRIAFDWNLRLYYKGMFYNLFLPGSIGGDAYKVMVLGQKTGGGYRKWVAPILLDRLTGLVILLAVIIFLFLFLPLPTINGSMETALVALVVGCLILFYWFVSTQFRTFKKVLIKAGSISVGVQFLQLSALCCLLSALKVPFNQVLSFAVLFYCGSVAAAIPVSLGGVGTRELIFATGATMLHLEIPVAVSVSLLFLVINAASSLSGGLLTVERGGVPEFYPPAGGSLNQPWL